jgi:hypothetical protein
MSSAGIRALPSHRPLIGSSARQGNTVATTMIAITRTNAPTARILRPR